MNVRTAQSAPDLIENLTPQRTIGRPTNVAPRATGSAAYASASQLASLGAYLEGLTTLARETGWHSPTMIVSFGDPDEEQIVVGIRWVGDTYFAEIR